MIHVLHIGVHYLGKEHGILAYVGDSSTNETKKVTPQTGDLTLAVTDDKPHAGTRDGVDHPPGSGASARGDDKSQPSAVPPVDASLESKDSSIPSTTGEILSNQSFDLWKTGLTEGAAIFAGGVNKAAELAAATLSGRDGSAILSFNPDWFTAESGDVDLAGQKGDQKPGRPLNLLPPGASDVPLTPEKTPTAKNDKSKPEIPLPPKKPSELKHGLPELPHSTVEKAPKVPAVAASFLPERVQPEADQQTVIVLDDYRDTNMILNNGKGFSHGELSARMAEENGFNVVRMQIGRFEGGRYDLPNSLSALNKAIDDGAVKAGKGDVVNMSFELGQTFVDASKMLGIKITPENLRDKREEILDIMRVKSVDKVHTPKKDRELMLSVLAIDDGVKQLQAKGLEVVVAGGNNGKNQFNLGFLSADKQYSALQPDGKIEPWSANNSLTTPGLGEVEFYSMPVNAYDKTPIAQQQGKYRVGGTNVFLPAEEFSGAFVPAIPENRDVLQMMLFDKSTISGGLTGFDKNAKTPPLISRFEGSAFTPLDAKAIGMPIQPTELSEFNPASWTVGINVLTAKGTSFVNVFKLKELQR